MDFSILDSESFKDILEAEIVKNYHAPVDIVFVEDVADWFAKRSDDCINNPVSVAVRDGITGGHGIIMCKEINSDRVESIICRMHFGGFDNAEEILCTPEIFMRHLILHELAHISNNWGQDREDDCDAWAFDRLHPSAV